MMLNNFKVRHYFFFINMTNLCNVKEKLATIEKFQIIT